MGKTNTIQILKEKRRNIETSKSGLPNQELSEGKKYSIRPLKGSRSKKVYSKHEHPCHRIKKNGFRLSSNLRRNS